MFRFRRKREPDVRLFPDVPPRPATAPAPPPAAAGMSPAIPDLPALPLRHTGGVCSKCGARMAGFPPWPGLECNACLAAALNEKQYGAWMDLPVVKQEELLRGTKYAKLCIGLDGSPEFRGIGYDAHPYQTEGYATCARGNPHNAPDPGCSCGYWIPARPDTAISTWKPDTVALEIEFAGVVLECSKTRPGDPYGYRAQWQRVLSVTLPPECGIASMSGIAYRPACAGKPAYLVSTALMSGFRLLLTACEAHVRSRGVTIISKPVSWLRRELQTEIRPGTVTDDPPPPLPDLLPAQAEYQAAVREILAKIVPSARLALPAGRTGEYCAVSHDGVDYVYYHNGANWTVHEITTPRLLAAYRDVQALIDNGTLKPGQLMIP